MRRVLYIVIMFSMISCGTKYDYLDTGVSNPYFEGDMYEYLNSDSYNWDSVVLMIDRAGLQQMFRTENITFMGLTNHTIRQWLIQGGKGYEYGYRQIADIPVNMCKAIILSHTIDGKHLRDDIARVELNEKGEYVGGGEKFVTHYGNTIWLWTKQSPYMGVDGLGPVYLCMTNLATNTIASADIQPYNGVVHSMEYSYKIDNIGHLPYE